MSNPSFITGKVYNLQDLETITKPCPAKRFLKALQVKPIDGIVTGDEILAAMERRAKTILLLPLPENLPRTRRNGPRNALASLDAQSIIAMRKQRQ